MEADPQTGNISSVQCVPQIISLPTAIFIVAFGTRGDAQPLLALGISLARSSPSSQVAFLTHEEHATFARRASHVPSNLRLHFVDTPPAECGEWSNDVDRGGDSNSSSASARLPFKLKERKTSLDLIRGTLQGVSDAQTPMWRPRTTAATHRQAKTDGLVVFNLFSLCAWHIAQSLGVPAVAASPYVPPIPSIDCSEPCKPKCE